MSQHATIVPRSPLAAPKRPAAPTRALVITSSFAASDMPARCGDNCYSYYFVQRAFAPLLTEWGEVHEVSRPEAELAPAIAALGRAGRAPAHLSFLPLQYVELAPSVPNVAFPFWEYPDVPNCDVAGNPRNNWPRVAEKLALILTACDFTRDALLRAGVRVPIHVVPVPIAGRYFEIDDWRPDERVVLECPCYVLPQEDAPGTTGQERPAATGLAARARGAYRRQVRPRMPAPLDRLLSTAGRTLLGRAESPPPPDPFPLPYAVSERLELSGVVYTSIFNPFDERKNWQDLLAAFLTATREWDDVTLVLKLAVSKSMAREGLHRVLSYHQRLGLRHRSRLAVISEYLSDDQMAALARASTYYLNASRGEGACLPLQDSLAAGRPAVTPAHTAMAEYIDERLAFVVASHSKPTHWSWDPERRVTTSWHCVECADLERQIRASRETAIREPSRYRDMAQEARARMSGFAGPDSVRPRLAEALGSIWTGENGTT
ncbi:MAG TPA: hypothetical protein VGX78_01255 [Pirellulales bacterium]|jgi:glycosyltransferase involved in cell wall biosynthesis|nr:hypothetical protein [Pirellulales bacterium]